MSRPAGPPPYTAEEIALLATPESRFIAQAELRSYIMGHKLADMREQGLLGSPTYNLTNNNSVAFGFRRGSSPFLSDTPDADSHEEDQGSPSGNTVGPQRGHPRSRRERRGLAGREPYSSFQNTRSKHAERSTALNDTHFRNNRVIGSNMLCSNFTSTGKCARLRCPDVHDITKLALCRRFLYKNVCTKDTLCSLSHDATSNNTPHCLYFLENRCTNSPCMFVHVHIDRNALVCQSFGKLGYCDEGEACSYLHVYECPDFANDGVCAAGEQCPLRHVHHASRMKAAARGSGVGSPESSVDTNDAADRDALSSPTENQNHAITQQHDYVAFESQD